MFYEELKNIITKKVVIDSSTGEVLQKDILYSSKAQQYIFDHLNEATSTILSSDNGS